MEPWRKLTEGDFKHSVPYQTHNGKGVYPKGKKPGNIPHKRTPKTGQTCAHGSECPIIHDKAAKQNSSRSPDQA